MNRACYEFFAGSCLAQNETGRVTGCNLGNMGQYRFQGGRCSYDLFKHRSFINFFPKSYVFSLQPLFSLLAIVNVGTGNIPSHDLPFVVAQRVVPSEKPTITSIRLAQPYLQLASSASRTSTVKKGAHPIPVIGVNEPTHVAYLPPLFQADTQIIEPHPIGVNTFVVGSEYADELGHKVQYLPQLRFLFPDLFFGSLQRDVFLARPVFRLLAILDISACTVPSETALPHGGIWCKLPRHCR